MRIAVDAMGGDHAPAEVVAGTLKAAQAHPEATFLLVGDHAAIEPLLAAHPHPGNLLVHHAPDVISMSDDPVGAVRRKPESSLCVSADMVASGEAQAVYSAGNTGAMAAAATLRIGRLPGVHRPCIASLLPVRGGKAVVADAGASVDCRPEWLVQFGVMASVYAQELLRIETPRVGLLNIGEESCKGNAVTKAAHELFAQNSNVHWIGNIDAKDTFKGVADVIACDGFWGNMLLKICEGAADFFMDLAKAAILSTPVSRVGGLLVRGSLRGMKRQIDYSEYGGAFLLGTRGLVVIGHGRSDAKAISNGLRHTVDGVARDLVGRLAARFAQGEVNAA